MATTVVDYGGGNIYSVLNALDELGEETVVAYEPDAIEAATRIVLPGVGAFPSAMGKLREKGLFDAIDRAVRKRSVPYLGICVGMQMMAEVGFEGGVETSGFGWIPGDVISLRSNPPAYRVPHMGWAKVNWHDGQPLSYSMRDGASFYFCHSYHVRTSGSDVCAEVEFEDSIIAALHVGSAIGVQFHPERSGNSGLKLIENFLDWDGETNQ